LGNVHTIKDLGVCREQGEVFGHLQQSRLCWRRYTSVSGRVHVVCWTTCS